MTDAWDGRPQNPEREGHHWCFVYPSLPFPVIWRHDGTGWVWGNGYTPEQAAVHWRYLGPCLTPDEVTAREVARAEAMREACASMLDTDADAAERRWAENGDRFGVGSRHVATLRRYAETLRALPIPHADALSRALAAAEKRGMERARDIAKEHAEATQSVDAWGVVEAIETALDAAAQEIEEEKYHLTADERRVFSDALRRSVKIIDGKEESHDPR